MSRQQPSFFHPLLRCLPFLIVQFLIALLIPFGKGCGPPPSPFLIQNVRAAPAAPLTRFEYHALKMGSDFNLVLYAPDHATAEAAKDAVFARVDQLTAVLSDYDSESEISRLNFRAHAGPMTQPAAVSQDLWNVLEASRIAFEQSGGAFDITLGPYVKLWQRSRRQQELPSAERLAAAKEAIGFDKLKLDPARHSAQLTAKGMRLDVGGIATGYISDDCIRVLRRRGIKSALIDCSGDLALGDPPPVASAPGALTGVLSSSRKEDKDPGEGTGGTVRKGWRVAIQSLVEPNKAVDYVELANCGISTSGDTYRFLEVEGLRYSHILDPKTGLGLTRRIGATVIAADDTTADWMATAVCILGPEKGLELVESMPSAAARITVVEGEKVQVFESKRYAKLTHPQVQVK